MFFTERRYITNELKMADDPERDLYPTKEVKDPSISSGLQVSDRHILCEKGPTVPLSRRDLEDQFYKFKEENYMLKKAAKNQEENLKKLATKMSRLLREKKSLELASSPGLKRDLELEEMVEDLQDKVRQLEKTNSHLREKMLVAKQQVIMQVKRPYSNIPPKVNSGNFGRSGISPYTSSVNLKGKSNPNFQRKAGNTAIPPYALTLLEEARNELSNLKMLISSQKTELEQYEHDNEILKQKLRIKEIEFQDELNMLKSQLTQHQRQHVQENLDLIRLHRELKQKNANYLTLLSQYNDTEEKMKILKLNHEHLLKEMDDLTVHFKAEQKKNLDLLGELQKAQLSLTATAELQERITVLQKENDFLRETNDKFVKNALAIEKERVVSMEGSKHLQIEAMLKEKITSLESIIEIQNKEKATFETELQKEKEACTVSQEMCIKLRESYDHLQAEVADLESKLNVLNSHKIELDELEEAISLLKLKKENKLNVNEGAAAHEVFRRKPVLEIFPQESISELPSNTEIPETSLVELEELRSRLEKAEGDHAEMVKELGNVQEMLTHQYTINQSAQDEIAALSEKLKQQEKEFEAKTQEYLHLLDLRSAKIKNLEKQLNNIAYGTHTVQTSILDMESEYQQTVELGKGENIFEIHIIKSLTVHV